jgi:hypothetical protein
MLHQWDQRARADARQTGNIRAWHRWRLSEIGRRDPDRPPPPVRQRYNHVRGAACRPLRHHRKPVSKKEMMGVGDREMRHDPAKNCSTLPCSAIPLTPMPSSIVSSTTPTASNSTAKACVGPEQSNRGRLDQTPPPVTKIHRPARLATRAASFRAGGRHHSGIPGGIIPLHPGGFVGIGTPRRNRR